ncbi:hypothetical protein HanRHA438_Chr03g0132361 [Helianthus annuus]|nr:hypothetical protein HanRHA438_Chr03g0132361 [Helianthus annuus]
MQYNEKIMLKKICKVDLSINTTASTIHHILKKHFQLNPLITSRVTYDGPMHSVSISALGPCTCNQNVTRVTWYT